MGTVPVALQQTAAFTDPKTGLLTPYGYQTILKLIQWGGGILPIDLANPLDVTGRLPYANQPTLAASHLLGRESGSAGNEEPISLGAGLSMTGTVLDVVGSALLTITTTLTNAQIKALPSTPIELVPAPGAGFQLVPFLCAVRGNTNHGMGSAYGNVDPDFSALYVLYAGGSSWSNYVINDSTLGYQSVTDLFTASHTFYWSFLAYTTAEPIYAWGNIAIPEVGIEENHALHLIWDNNAAGNLTGGVSANSLAVTTYYTIVPVGV